MTLQNKCANKLNKRYIVRLYIQRTKLAKDTLFFGYGKKELNLKDIYLCYVFLNSQYAAAIKIWTTTTIAMITRRLLRECIALSQLQVNVCLNF